MKTLQSFDGPRRVRPDEFPGVRQLFATCFGHSTEEDTPSNTKAVEKALPDSEETCVIAHRNTPVSLATLTISHMSFCGTPLKVGHIGGVCTHPEFRGHRLGTLLLEYGAERLAKTGARLILISGARGLYRRAGCVPAGKFAGFSFDAGCLFPSRDTISIRPAVPSDAVLCARLHQQEAVHYRRNAAKYTNAFRSREIGFRAENWIVELNGRAAAYLLMNIPWDHVGDPNTDYRCVFEYAGSRIALHGALSAVLRRQGIRHLEVPIAWQDTDLIHPLGKSAPYEWVSLPDHTHRILDFPGLMSDLQEWSRARLSPNVLEGVRFEQSGSLLSGGNDRFAITAGNDRLELDGAEMSALVLGSGSLGCDIAASAPGSLAEIVDALFPLPSYYAGLDYH